MTDALESTFQELCRSLVRGNRLAATHGDPFFTFVHKPAETLELHQRLPMWCGILEREHGLQVKIQSLSALVWDIVDRSARWDDWLEAEEPSTPQHPNYQEASKSMRDVLLREQGGGASAARPGLTATLAPFLLDETPGRLLLLTDAGLLHPWIRPEKIGTELHDKIRCPTVLLYPGTRRGQYGLNFLGFYPEDPSAYRTTILGGS